MPLVAISGIVPERESPSLEIRGNFPARKRQERTQEQPGARRHPGETGWPAPVENSEKHGFNLVIGMMRRYDVPRALPVPGFLEPGVARLAGSGFRGIRPQVQVSGHASQVVGPSTMLHLLGDHRAIRMNAMVHVGDYQIQPMAGLGSGQQVQEGHGIGASRDRDESSLPGRRAHVPQSLEQSLFHTIKISPSAIVVWRCCEYVQTMQETRSPTIPALKASAAAQLAAIVESSIDAIVSKQLDGTILSWNQAAERIFGYTAEEMVGTSIYRLIPDDLHPEEAKILARAARGEQVAHYETTRIRKDGNRIFISLTVSPVRDGEGNIVGVASIKRDITETRNLGEMVRQATRISSQMAAIVESSVDAIVSKQLDGTVMSWNRAAERIFGYTAEEMVGSSIYRLIPDELHAEEADILSRISRGEQVAHYETTRVRKDGSRVTISLTVSPVFDAAGNITGVASIKRDITESKRLEQLVRQATKMEAIGRLAGGLAHDFNNHLHALSGFAHFIDRDPGLNLKSRRDLQQIHKITDRMASLTHQLLAFARQQVLIPETIDLPAIIEDTQPMLQRLIGSTYELDLSHADGHSWVRVDRGQIVQVLMNLVTNARDAMPEGGKVEIRTSAQEVDSEESLDVARNPIAPGSYAVLEVVDQGVGIDAQSLDRLFEPFFTTKEVGKGTGLGLATVEGIVSQSKGYIQIDTAVDLGTTFRILLPMYPPPASQT
jgi:PAS domain S-box-containing protein